MKRRIADMMYNFYMKHHTHNYVAFSPNYMSEKCTKCGHIKWKYSIKCEIKRV